MKCIRPLINQGNLQIKIRCQGCKQQHKRLLICNFCISFRCKYLVLIIVDILLLSDALLLWRENTVLLLPINSHFVFPEYFETEDNSGIETISVMLYFVLLTEIVSAFSAKLLIAISIPPKVNLGPFCLR